MCPCRGVGQTGAVAARTGGCRPGRAKALDQLPHPHRRAGALGGNEASHQSRDAKTAGPSNVVPIPKLVDVDARGHDIGPRRPRAARPHARCGVRSIGAALLLARFLRLELQRAAQRRRRRRERSCQGSVDLNSGSMQGNY